MFLQFWYVTSYSMNALCTSSKTDAGLFADLSPQPVPAVEHDDDPSEG